MLYKSGMRTPNAQQIEQITAQLGKYGKIEGKNVFYWFQNHKARERQKQKRNSLGLGHCPRTPTSITTITLDTRVGAIFSKLCSLGSPLALVYFSEKKKNAIIEYHPYRRLLGRTLKWPFSVSHNINQILTCSLGLLWEIYVKGEKKNEFNIIY